MLSDFPLILRAGNIVTSPARRGFAGGFLADREASRRQVERVRERRCLPAGHPWAGATVARYGARVSPASYRLDDTLRARVESNLARFERRQSRAEGLAPAAVALVLVADDIGEACFVITRRARGLRRHANQWALPGGRLDPGEEPVQAARRELREEVGLELPEEATLGLLDDYATRSGFAITPVVLWGGPNCTLAPDGEEVAEIYRVPLKELDKPAVPRLRSTPDGDHPLISIPLLGTYIHAPTAAILYQLREVAMWGRATRVAHYEQPRFAWR